MLNETISEAIQKLTALPKNAENAAKSVAQKINPLTAISQAVLSTPGQIEQAMAETGKKVEQFAHATLALQAVAAFAAVGMLLVQWQLLSKSRRQPVRANPRRKRGRR